MHRYPPKTECRFGFSSANVVVALPVIVMMSWLAVELGLGLRAMEQARAASDSIALAAAARARDGHQAARADALAAAASSRGPNGPVLIEMGTGPGGGGDVEIGSWDDDTRTFTPDPSGGDAVRARVRFAADHPNGTFAPFLSGLFGPTSVAIERTSVAVHVRARHTTSLLLTEPSGVTLALEGAAALDADGGVSVRSSAQPCVTVAGSASLSASVVRAVGFVDAGSLDRIEAAILDGFSAPADPFSATALPALEAGNAIMISHDDLGTTQVAPGVHAAITISGGSVVLMPGLHQFAGSIVVQGGSLVLQDATVHIQESASLTVTGNGIVSGTPGLAGDWAGTCIIQRGASSVWVVDTSGSMDVDGILYAPDVSLLASVGAQLVLDSAILRSVAMSGNAQVAFDDDIDALKDTPVPGRARLVR